MDESAGDKDISFETGLEENRMDREEMFEGGEVGARADGAGEGEAVRAENRVGVEEVEVVKGKGGEGVGGESRDEGVVDEEGRWVMGEGGGEEDGVREGREGEVGVEGDEGGDGEGGGMEAGDEEAGVETEGGGEGGALELGDESMKV